jgi:origin recognition complex subunit 6
VRTPSSKLRTADAESPSPSTRQLPSRGTPTKDQSLEQFRRSSRAGGDATPKSTGRFAEADKPAALHPWLLPVIRFLCNETENKKLIPTMVAGIESIVAPQGRRTTDEWILGHLTSLLAAISFFVVMRVKAIKSGETVGRETYIPQRKSILALLERARNEVSMKAGKDAKDDGDESWQGWSSVRPRDFDDAVSHVKEQGWLTGDWFKALADVVRMGGDEDEDEDMAEADGDVGVLGAVRRADTMFQDKYDYLSEAKRADYKVWKEAMLSKISQLASVGAMEIDS